MVAFSCLFRASCVGDSPLSASLGLPTACYWGGVGGQKRVLGYWTMVRSHPQGTVAACLCCLASMHYAAAFYSVSGLLKF